MIGTLVIGIFVICTFLIGTLVIRTFVIGTFVIGAFVIGTLVIGTFVIGTFVIGAFVIGVFVIGAFVIGTFFIWSFVSGTFVTETLPCGLLSLGFLSWHCKYLEVEGGPTFGEVVLLSQRPQPRLGSDVDRVDVVDGSKRSPDFVRKERFESCCDHRVGQKLFDSEVARLQLHRRDGRRRQFEAR